MIGRHLRCNNGHVFDRTVHGRQCPYCHLEVKEHRKSTERLRPIGEIKEMLLLEEIMPVVGWLVCIEGPRQGMSYNLYMGKNFLGRADDMDVQLLGDISIAPRNHATVAYDPKIRSFMLVPGESQGLVYLENKSVFQATQLFDMQRIQIGHTTLIFRELCGDNFAWEAEIRELPE